MPRGGANHAHCDSTNWTVAKMRIFTIAAIVALFLMPSLASAQAIYGSSGASVRVLCSDATQHTMGANTAQTILATCTIPANALSAGSVVRIGQLWSFTGNTDTKAFQFWLNSSPIVSGGTQMFGTSTASASNTTLSANQTLFAVRDASTEINNNSFWGGFSAQTMSIVHYSTTSALYIVITGTQTTTADNLALEHYVVEILPPGGN